MLESANAVCEVNVLAYMHDLGNKVLSDLWELDFGGAEYMFMRSEELD